MAEEFVPDTEDTFIPDEPIRIRPSNPVRQSLASVTDIATGIPMFLGAVGSGIGTAFDRDEDEKTGFGAEFLKNLIENPVYKFGASQREKVNKFFKIKEPLSIEDQVARYAFSMFIPGVWPLAGLAKGASLLSKAVRIATPLVRLQKGKPVQNVARIGTQIGVGGAIDQTVRAVIGEFAPDSPGAVLTPTMFSESAIKGVEASKYKEALEAIQPITSAFIPDDQDYLNELNKFRPEQADLDRRMETNEDEKSSRGLIVTGVALAAAIFGLRKLQSLKSFPLGMNVGPKTKTDALGTAFKIIKDDPVKGPSKVGKIATGRFHERWMDSSALIRRLMLEAGVPKEQVKQLDGQDIVDAFGSTSETIQTGVFLGGRKTESLADITRKISSMSEERQGVFVRGIASLREDRVRDIATAELGETRFGRRKPGLWQKDGQPVPDDRLDANIEALLADEELWVLTKRVAKINNDILEEAALRGPLTPKIANEWRERFTGKYGLLYFPGKETTERSSWYTKLAELMGFHTTKSKELQGVDQWHKLGLEDRGGIIAPLDPLHSTADYMYHTMDHIARSNAQINIAQRLAGIDISPSGVVTHSKVQPKSLAVKYVGRVDPEDPGNVRGNVVWASDPEFEVDASTAKAFRLGEKTDINTLLAREDALVVQHKGQRYVFHVEDPHTKIALELKQTLTGWWEQFFSQWRSNFTQFTTGKLSAFAPTAFLYNQQLGTINAFIKEGPLSAAHMWIDSFRGATEFFAVRTARDVSNLLMVQLERNLGLARLSPELAKRINNSMQKRIARSIMPRQQRESGSFSSSIGSGQFSGNVTNILEESVPYINKRFGTNALPLIWRIWKNYNSALHEGTALGRVMREASKLDGPVSDAKMNQLLRTWTRGAKDLIGDVRRRGTTPVARAFHTAVPFSGAMFQAWSTLGDAIRKNPRMVLPALITTIGLPTAMEVTWNSALDPEAVFTDESGKKWTYGDYYWNGFTTEQRNNNLIAFIPGKPPWEAFVVPISPEFTLFRAVVIEGMDVLFGMSQGIAKETGNNGNHIIAALTRIFDIPVPPPLGALFSAITGYDFRVGINPQFEPGKGEVLNIFAGIPLGRGARVTGSAGTVKDIGDEFGKRLVATLYDLFGAGASLGVAMAEAYFGGRDDKPQDFTDRLGNAFSEGVIMTGKQARWTNPMFGKALSPNPNNDIAREVFAKKDALTRATKDLDPIGTEGQVVSGRKVMGNTVISPKDPIYTEVASGAQSVLNGLKPFEENISKLRINISTMENSNVDGDGNSISMKKKRDIIDALKLEISSEKAKELIVLKMYERKVSEVLSNRLGRNITVNLTGFSARSNLP